MDRANYSAEKRKIMAEIFAKRDYFYGVLRQEDGWTVVNDDKKNGVKISTTDSKEREGKIMHSTGVINHNIQDVICTMHDFDYKKTFDVNVEVAKTLERVGPNTFYTYQKSKGMLVVSSRDFVLLHHIH